jgi:hypothetical protein
MQQFARYPIFPDVRGDSLVVFFLLMFTFCARTFAAPALLALELAHTREQQTWNYGGMVAFFWRE